MPRTSIISDRPAGTGPPTVEPRCVADGCDGLMLPTTQTMGIPAWGHDTIALLRCASCGERAWFRQLRAFEPLPLDLEVT